MSAASSWPAVFGSQLPEQMQVYTKDLLILVIVGRWRGCDLCMMASNPSEFCVFFTPAAPLRALDCAAFRFLFSGTARNGIIVTTSTVL